MHIIWNTSYIIHYTKSYLESPVVKKLLNDCLVWANINFNRNLQETIRKIDVFKRVWKTESDAAQAM